MNKEEYLDSIEDKLDSLNKSFSLLKSIDFMELAANEKFGEMDELIDDMDVSLTELIHIIAQYERYVNGEKYDEIVKGYG
jgi:hypothetical protein